MFFPQKFQNFAKIEIFLDTFRPLFLKIEKSEFPWEKATFSNFYFFIKIYLILGNFRQILKIFDSKIKKLGAIFPRLFCSIHVLHRGRPPRRRDF